MGSTFHTDIGPAVQAWAAEHPREVEAMTELHEAGISHGVFSSTVSELVGRVVDRPPHRPPDDIDLLVEPSQFMDAAGLLGARVVEDSPIEVRTGDLLTLRFRADEAVAGGEDTLPIQFLRPHGSVEDDSHAYDTRFSETVAESGLIIVETDQGIVTLADPIETLSMQAILRRCDGNKTDALNAVRLSQLYRVEGNDYAKQRAAEIGWDGRVWEFVEWAGRRATLLSNGTPQIETVATSIS